MVQNHVLWTTRVETFLAYDHRSSGVADRIVDSEEWIVDREAALDSGQWMVDGEEAVDSG